MGDNRTEIKTPEYPGDFAYWQARYKSRYGTRSGEGSRGRLLAYKAHMVNLMVEKYFCRTIVDIGCGDAAYVPLLEFEAYNGYDISPAGLWRASMENGFMENASYSLYLPGMFASLDPVADIAVSLDVLMHITGEDNYLLYVEDLFSAARSVVLIYAPPPYFQNDEHTPAHVRYRNWRQYVPTDAWQEHTLPENPFALMHSMSIVGSKTESRFHLFTRKK